MPREDAYVCLQNSYKSVDFEVVKNNAKRYLDKDQIALVNFGPVALFGEAKLTTSSGNQLEKVDIFYFICLMHKILTFHNKPAK